MNAPRRGSFAAALTALTILFSVSFAAVESRRTATAPNSILQRTLLLQFTLEGE